ncbi:RNA polymerase subunit sigma-70, partial [Bacteroides caecigallinarum]|uniref:sigma factor-like helix-turn-helix DNA-binding protein n=1 Tax=Bacteroides caecigallinarum TaxID=1411144 RepID=UPI001D5DBF64
SNINYKDILSLEKSRIKSLPKQRRIIYIKNRFNHKTVGEIAEELSISKRTVEGHLLQGRKQVRDYIRRCI